MSALLWLGTARIPHQIRLPNGRLPVHTLATKPVFFRRSSRWAMVCHQLKPDQLQGGCDWLRLVVSQFEQVTDFDVEQRSWASAKISHSSRRRL
jgi:hypothetical protein